jgi:hypothetical protein
MIIGAHSILYSKAAESDREFLRDVLKMPYVDVHGGWLIFGLPPAEVAIHPSEKNDVHEFYLMVDDVDAFVADLSRRGVNCSPVQSMGWGMLTQVTLPGGGKLGVYQPRHGRPRSMPAARAKGKKTARRPAARAVRKTASKRKTARRR